jgi:hypothetical protein
VIWRLLSGWWITRPHFGQVVPGGFRTFALGRFFECSFASGDPGNTGEIGDIYRIPPKLWLVRNEVGGWTAMYPEGC